MKKLLILDSDSKPTRKVLFEELTKPSEKQEEEDVESEKEEPSKNEPAKEETEEIPEHPDKPHIEKKLE